MQSDEVLPCLRSKLFVPAIRPDMFPKALAGDADAICFDLEEGVPAERKAEARENLGQFFNRVDSPKHPAFLVRVNPATSRDLRLDLAVAVQGKVTAVALPKVETASEIQLAHALLDEIERENDIKHRVLFLLTIETPRGLRLAADLAQSSTRVVGLQLGFADLLEPLGISSDDTSARSQIRLMLRLAAAEANLACFESAYPPFNDDDGFAVQLRNARSLGFVGASCIHPRQIAIANRVFTPTAEEIEYANGVVKAAEDSSRQGSAIAQFRGKMIDRPLLLRARAILSFRNPKAAI